MTLTIYFIIGLVYSILDIYRTKDEFNKVSTQVNLSTMIFAVGITIVLWPLFILLQIMLFLFPVKNV